MIRWYDSDTMAASALDDASNPKTKAFPLIYGSTMAQLVHVYVDHDAFGGGATDSNFVIRPYIMLNNTDDANDATKRNSTKMVAGSSTGTGATAITVLTGATPAADILTYRLGYSNPSPTIQGRWLRLECDNTGTAYTTGNIRFWLDFMG